MVWPIRKMCSTKLFSAAIKVGLPLAMIAFAPISKGLDKDPTADIGKANRPANQNEYPAEDVHVAVESHAKLAQARATYHRLQDALNQSINLVQYNFEHSPDMLDAQKMEQQAWEDYQAARATALKSVKADPVYQANMALKQDMGSRIQETRAIYDARTPADKNAAVAYNEVKMNKIVTMAYAKLDYAQVVSDMEVVALKADSKVADMRSKLMTAGTKVKTLKDAFALSVRNNTELAALRGKIDDARIALISAEAFRDGAVQAANTALDYAYYKNRNRNSYGSSYEYGTYTGYRN